MCIGEEGTCKGGDGGSEENSWRKKGVGGDRKVPPKLTILLILDEGTALSRALDVNCSKQVV